MVKPEDVKQYAKIKEEENYKFRTFLKFHVDDDELDEQFQNLHKELFSNYDCSACRNCCTMYSGSLYTEEVAPCASFLGMDVDAFKQKYLKPEEDGLLQVRHRPCDFLQEDGSCLLGEHKPIDCVDFPYTNRPDRMGSLLSIIEFSGTCPVLYEMLERLKAEYGFIYPRRKGKH